MKSRQPWFSQVNKKEALHNKFKGRGNYAILDDLVGGSGNILKQVNQKTFNQFNLIHRFL